VIRSNGEFAVFLVDDDPGFLKALAKLLDSHGYRTYAFGSSEDFLTAHDASLPGCAVIDLAMPGLDGLALQRALVEAEVERPIIFLSGRANVPSSVHAMQAGAVDFLEKPVDSDILLTAIERAAARDRDARKAAEERKTVVDRVNRLTPREFEVLGHVIAGRLNKQIAYDLGTVERTVKIHRTRMMAKMGVQTVVDLVRLTEKVNLAPAHQTRPTGANTQRA
jgi:FixJ family two-component response regulator